jgi:nitric oxide reductase subunit C
MTPSVNFERVTPFVITPLFLAFCGWTAFVYLDAPPHPAPPVTVEEASGKRVWQHRNCMACHQIYGLGGYLGPDLTNVATRRGDATVQKILREGTKLMPRLGLSEQEISDLGAYLKAVDRTGVFPPKNGPLQGMNNSW